MAAFGLPVQRSHRRGARWETMPDPGSSAYNARLVTARRHPSSGKPQLRARPTRAFFASLLLLLCAAPLHAEIDDSDLAKEPAARHPLLEDAKAYVTSPLHWDSRDWLLFGGTVAGFAVAHHYDTDVRTHFTRNMSPQAALSTKSSNDLQDAAPAAALFGATWIYAHLIDDAAGRNEARDMLEAGAFSTVASYLAKYAAGRKRPDETTDPNSWRAGGSSFPSLHVSAASAVGAVLAESGGDDYRWLRRTLGYGVAGFTAYERLKHNQHWLSDTVVGAALGTSTGWFIVHRHERALDESASSFSVVPVERGAMFTYTRNVPN